MTAAEPANAPADIVLPIRTAWMRALRVATVFGTDTALASAHVGNSRGAAIRGTEGYSSVLGTPASKTPSNAIYSPRAAFDLADHLLLLLRFGW